MLITVAVHGDILPLYKCSQHNHYPLCVSADPMVTRDYPRRIKLRFPFQQVPQEAHYLPPGSFQWRMGQLVQRGDGDFRMDVAGCRGGMTNVTVTVTSGSTCHGSVCVGSIGE